MPSRSDPERAGRLVPALVFVAVLAVRALAWASLEASPLSDWHLWTETDEWGYVDWSARIASGNWLDVPAWRSYFSWQEPFGPPGSWERWYQKNAYFAGPLYPYALALIRKSGLPLLPAVRLLQLLLACVAAAALAAAVQSVSSSFLRRRKDREAPGLVAGSSASAAAGMVAGLFYGLYGPLVFHDGFAYRDGPVAHVSALLLAWPLIAAARARGPRGGEAFLLGLLGGLAALLKQTTLPLALVALFFLSKRSPDGVSRRRAISAALLGLGLPLLVLGARNVSVGVPPLTFDTRQAIGLAWGNLHGADATTALPPGMDELLEDAAGSTSKTAWLVLRSYAGSPLDLPILFAKKFATFFLAFEVPDNSSWYFFRDRLPPLRALPVFPCLFGVGMAGIVAALVRGVLRTDEGWLMAVALATPLAACLLVQTTSRYRIGGAPPLAVGAGLLVFLCLDEGKVRRTRTVVSWTLGAVLLSVLSAFLPSPIPTPRVRWADAIVAATLAEAREGPEAGAAEIRRYLEEGRNDPQREAGERGALAWLSGERAFTRVAPPGVAPPERRYKVKTPGG
ncbi:MAG TPA: hypothetical protein VLH41_02050 [Thermoanaerobaculia bacterium]|nr:hypothetical protein [Thermoanaerobaculia bacterium]